MKNFIRIALMIAMALSLLPTQVFAVETVATLSIDDEDNDSAEFTSDFVAGAAPSFFLGAPSEYECGDTGPNCEYFLVEVTGLTQEEIDAGEAAGEPASDRVNVTIGIRDNMAVGDFDMILYASDADATKGGEIGRLGEIDTELIDEEMFTQFTATASNPTGYFLVEVVLFGGAGTYDGYVSAS